MKNRNFKQPIKLAYLALLIPGLILKMPVALSGLDDDKSWDKLDESLIGSSSHSDENEQEEPKFQLVTKKELKSLFEENRKKNKKIPFKERAERGFSLSPFILESKSQFNKTNFSGLVMKNCNFSGSILGETDSNGTTTHTTFENSILNSCNFSNSIFYGKGNFKGSNLKKVSFNKVQFYHELDFEDANLEEASLANVEYRRLQYGYLENKWFYPFNPNLPVNFKNANLSKANLHNMGKGNFNFSGANLKDAIIDGAELGNSIFNLANLEGVDFTKAKSASCRSCHNITINEGTKFTPDMIQQLINAKSNVYVNGSLVDFENYYKTVILPQSMSTTETSEKITEKSNALIQTDPLEENEDTCSDGPIPSVESLLGISLQNKEDIPTLLQGISESVKEASPNQKEAIKKILSGVLKFLENVK